MTDWQENAPGDEPGAQSDEQQAKEVGMPKDIILDKRAEGKGFYGAKRGSYNIDDPDRPRWGRDTAEEARYEYRRADGAHAFYVVRGRNPNGERPAKQERLNTIPHKERFEPDQQREYLPGRGDEPPIPYCLPELIKAAKEPGALVLVVEGEKDVETARRLGFTATTNPDGAGKWRDEYSTYMAGCRVAVIPDNDEVGRKHADKVVRSVQGGAQSVVIVELPGLREKGDLTDWAEGKADAADALRELIESAPPAQPKKATVANVDNVARVIETNPDWSDVVVYDEFFDELVLLRPVPGTTTPKTTFRPRQWRDSDDVRAQRWFNRNGFPRVAKSTVADAIMDVAQHTVVSPVREYLEGLTWDGECRLDRWLIDYCGAEAADDDEAAFVAEVGRRWMISAVARALKPGCKADACLVLEGKQGVGKSTLLRILADGGIEPEGERSWFSDSLQGFTGKDSQSALRGCWIVELPELAAMKRAEVEHVKSYLSRQTDRFRPAYERREVDVARRCVFAGTTNRTDYLKDETGNRRFWPVRVTNIDVDKLTAGRDQLWAEAVQALSKGERWHLTGAAAKYQVKAAEERAEEDPWSVVLDRLSDVKEIAACDVLELLGKDVGDQTKGDAMRASAMLERAGWRKQGKFTGGLRRNRSRFVNPDGDAQGEMSPETMAEKRKNGGWEGAM